MCLVIGALGPLTFKVIIDTFVLTVILLLSSVFFFVFFFFYRSLFLSSSLVLFLYDLMNLLLCFIPFSLLSVYLLEVCGYHEVHM